MKVFKSDTTKWNDWRKEIDALLRSIVSVAKYLNNRLDENHKAMKVFAASQIEMRGQIDDLIREVNWLKKEKDRAIRTSKGE